MKVRDLMTSDPATVSPNDPCSRAAELMRQENCGSIPVLRDRQLAGIVTDRDIVIRAIAMGKDPSRTPVSEVMSSDPVTVAPDTETDEAARLMAEFQVRRLPVVEDGRLVGIFVTAQLAGTEGRRDTGQTLKEISEPASVRASQRGS